MIIQATTPTACGCCGCGGGPTMDLKLFLRMYDNTSDTLFLKVSKTKLSHIAIEVERFDASTDTHYTFNVYVNGVKQDTSIPLLARYPNNWDKDTASFSLGVWDDLVGFSYDDPPSESYVNLLFNNCEGLQYSEVGTGPIDFQNNIYAWWEFEEASGTREDSWNFFYIDPAGAGVSRVDGKHGYGVDIGNSSLDYTDWEPFYEMVSEITSEGGVMAFWWKPSSDTQLTGTLFDFIWVPKFGFDPPRWTLTAGI